MSAVVIKLNLINGVLFSPIVTQQTVDKLRGISLFPDDVFVVTYPKSGTTLTQQIIKLIKLGGNDDSSKHVFDAIPFIETKGEQLETILQSLPSPRALKTHLPYQMMSGGDPAKSVAKYIYIARNPKDVAVSLFYHIFRFKEFMFDGDWNSFFELFMKGEVECGSWFDHVLEWWKHKDADNILFMKYEDMIKDLRGSVQKIAQFMCYNLDDSVIDKITEQCTFDSMKANPLANPDCLRVLDKVKKNSTPFLRKGIIGDWRNHFTDEQSSRLDDEYVKRMRGTGLELSFD